MYSTLYRSLAAGPKEQTKLAIKSGDVILKPKIGADDGKKVLIIEKMRKVVAKDTLVDRISRIACLNKAVHQCVRMK